VAAPIVDLFKGSNRVALVGLTTLTLIVGIATGDYIGQSRHKSTVDEAIAMVIKKDSLAPKRGILERAAIEAVLKATGDRWSNYFPAESVDVFNQGLQGRYSGVGIWLRNLPLEF
jgi:C-terminal processing protease CtpA/Prc